MFEKTYIMPIKDYCVGRVLASNAEITVVEIERTSTSLPSPDGSMIVLPGTVVMVRRRIPIYLDTSGPHHLIMFPLWDILATIDKAAFLNELAEPANVIKKEAGKEMTDEKDRIIEGAAVEAGLEKYELETGPMGKGPEPGPIGIDPANANKSGPGN